MSLKDTVRWPFGGMLWKVKPADMNGPAVIPVAALREWADEQEEYEPTHRGSCGPEAGCDAACMANAEIARRNHQRRVVRDLLAELEGVE